MRRPPLRSLLFPLAGALSLAAPHSPARSAEEPTPVAQIPVRAEQPRPGLFRDRFELPAGADLMRLSWRGLPWGCEALFRSGKRMERGKEYTLDYAQGVVRLLRPATDPLLVEAYYRAPSFLAHPNLTLESTAPEPEMPRGWRKARREGPPPALMAATRALSSELRMGKTTTAGEEEEDAPRTESSPLRAQLESGFRVTEAQEQLTGRGRNSGSYAYYRTDPVDPQLAQSGREQFSTKLDLRSDRSGRLVFNSELERSSLFAEEYEEHERQRLNFEQTWGKSAAALMWERRRSDGYGVANSLDALSLSLTHPFSRNTAAEGLLAYENSLFSGWETSSLLSLRQAVGRRAEAQANLLARGSEYSGNALDTGASFTVRPTDSSQVKVQADRSNSEQYGQYGRFQGEANFSLGSRVQILAEASRRTSDRYGVQSTYGIGMAARPTARTLLETAFSESVGDATGREEARSVRMSYLPSSSVRVQLGYDLQTSSLDGMNQNGLWLVSIGGRRYLKAEGYSGVREVGDASLMDAVYRLEARPVGLMAVSGSLRRVLSMDELRQTAGLGANLYLARGVNLSAGYRRPLSEDGQPLPPEMAGHDVRLLLAPLTGFRLFGQYAYRPDDEQGGLLDQEERTLGLETHLGALGFQGSITQLQGLAAAEPGRRSDFLASLALGGLKLYGGIRLEEDLAQDSLRREIYRLGVTHAAGGSFFLMLEGQMAYTVGTGTRAYSPSDTRAQARLGIRF